MKQFKVQTTQLLARVAATQPPCNKPHSYGTHSSPSSSSDHHTTLPPPSCSSKPHVHIVARKPLLSRITSPSRGTLKGLQMDELEHMIVP